MHFAASAYVGESVNKPLKYYDNNVSGTISLLKAMKSADINNLVFSSSCATYGIHKDPISEKTSQEPINPYGRTKLMCEQIISDYVNISNLKYSFLRYFNVAGCLPSGLLGEDHEPETHLIPNVIKAAINGTEVTVYGQNYSESYDGTCIRDYIHVCDLAEAHMVVAEKMIKENTNLTYNVGIGKGYSVKEVISEVERVAGTKIKVHYTGPRIGDPAILVADASKILLDTPWKAQYNLTNMINHAYNYLKGF
jgi:UDP-glucose 4-epimerase